MVVPQQNHGEQHLGLFETAYAILFSSAGLLSRRSFSHMWKEMVSKRRERT